MPPDSDQEQPCTQRDSTTGPVDGPRGDSARQDVTPDGDQAPVSVSAETEAELRRAVERRRAEQRSQSAASAAKMPSGMRLLGLGSELAAGIAGFTLMGWWLDRTFDTSPRYVAIGATIGAVGGMFNLVRQAVRIGRETMQVEPGTFDAANDALEETDRRDDAAR